MMIEADDLVVRYGAREALRGLSFTVADGELFGLLGPNGAGKTTTIAALCGLVDPHRGVVRVGGRDCRTERRRVRELIGLVPQHLAFYGSLSARQNLDFFARLQGCHGADLDARVERALAFAQLTDRADERVAGFSGGMKRRLNVAIGMLHDPALLILDEPTVGVDAQSRAAMLAGFDELRGGTTILYTTHLMEEAQRLCDRVAIVDAGRVVAVGRPADLIARHGSALVRARFEAPPPADLSAALAAVAEVRAVSGRGDTLEVTGADGRALLDVVRAAARSRALDLRAIEMIEADLDSVFLALTGRAPRD